MCLAIPGRVVSIGEHRMAEIEVSDVKRTASLDLVPDAVEGSWVLVHAGYAIRVLDEKDAADTWELVREITETMEPLEIEIPAAVEEAQG